MKNWKTTLIGALAGSANIVQNGVTWQSALLSIAITLLGALAKDFDSHSTTAQVQDATKEVMNVPLGK